MSRELVGEGMGCGVWGEDSNETRCNDEARGTGGYVPICVQYYSTVCALEKSDML